MFVFNYAGVGAAVGQAESEASRILAASGVKLDWVECPDSPAEISARIVCAQAPQSTGIVVHILAQSASRRSSEPNALGFAAPAGKDFAAAVVVFFPRVEELSRRHAIEAGIVAGAVLAHEIGHLLLGPGAHSPSGIMAAEWHQRELEELKHHSLVFATSQARQMRCWF